MFGLQSKSMRNNPFSYLYYETYLKETTKKSLSKSLPKILIFHSFLFTILYWKLFRKNLKRPSIAVSLCSKKFKNLMCSGVCVYDLDIATRFMNELYMNRRRLDWQGNTRILMIL